MQQPLKIDFKNFHMLYGNNYCETKIIKTGAYYIDKVDICKIQAFVALTTEVFKTTHTGSKLHTKHSGNEQPFN